MNAFLFLSVHYGYPVHILDSKTPRNIGKSGMSNPSPISGLRHAAQQDRRIVSSMTRTKQNRAAGKIIGRIGAQEWDYD